MNETTRPTAIKLDMVIPRDKAIGLMQCLEMGLNEGVESDEAASVSLYIQHHFGVSTSGRPVSDCSGYNCFKEGEK